MAGGYPRPVGTLREVYTFEALCNYLNLRGRYVSIVAPRLAGRVSRQRNRICLTFRPALACATNQTERTSALVLHHRECRFQMQRNRDSRLHAHHCGHSLAALVALYRASSHNHGVDLGRLPKRCTSLGSAWPAKLGANTRMLTVRPITPASSRSQSRSGRSWRSGCWPGWGIIWASGGSRC